MNMGQCTSTEDLAVASAIAGLQVPVRPQWTIHEKKDQQRKRFELGLESVDGSGHRTKQILNAQKDGTLEAGHPYLNMLRAQENRECLLDLQKKGIFCELRPVEGAPGIWAYVPGGQGLPGLKDKVRYFQTRDLHLVSALGLAGFPLVWMEGSGNAHRYYIPRTGPSRAPHFAELDVEALSAERRRAGGKEGDLSWLDPVTQGLRVFRYRNDLLEAMRAMGPKMILQPRGEGVKRAVVQLSPEFEMGEGAKEQVRRFFGR